MSTSSPRPHALRQAQRNKPRRLYGGEIDIRVVRGWRPGSRSWRAARVSSEVVSLRGDKVDPELLFRFLLHFFVFKYGSVFFKVGPRLVFLFLFVFVEMGLSFSRLDQGWVWLKHVNWWGKRQCLFTGSFGVPFFEPRPYGSAFFEVGPPENCVCPFGSPSKPPKRGTLIWVCSFKADESPLNLGTPPRIQTLGFIDPGLPLSHLFLTGLLMLMWNPRITSAWWT